MSRQRRRRFILSLCLTPLAHEVEVESRAATTLHWFWTDASMVSNFEAGEASSLLQENGLNVLHRQLLCKRALVGRVATLRADEAGIATSGSEGVCLRDKAGGLRGSLFLLIFMLLS